MHIHYTSFTYLFHTYPHRRRAVPRGRMMWLEYWIWEIFCERWNIDAIEVDLAQQMISASSRSVKLLALLPALVVKFRAPQIDTGTQVSFYLKSKIISIWKCQIRLDCFFLRGFAFSFDCAAVAVSSSGISLAKRSSRSLTLSINAESGIHFNLKNGCVHAAIAAIWPSSLSNRNQEHFRSAHQCHPKLLLSKVYNISQDCLRSKWDPSNFV